jgi:hypothetical protein
MEDMTSSKLALRNLLKDSKEKRVLSSVTQDRAIVNQPINPTAQVIETDDKRKEQLRLGKVIFDFFEKSTAPTEEILPKIRSKGRPTKPKEEKAKNITICLSKEHIELLDKASFQEKGIKGRGRKVRYIMDSFIKYQKREKDQVRSVQESLRQLAISIDSFSKNYKRAEKFSENEKVMADLEKSISNLRILLGLLKIEISDLKKLLTDKEWSTYQFALSWISNRAGDQ